MQSSIVHLGLPKTASTFLQKQYFNRVEGYEYYTSFDKSLLPGEFSWIFDVNKAKFIKREGGAYSSSFDFTHHIPACKKAVTQSEKPVLLSSEGLCGISWSPIRNSKSIANALNSIFNAPRVILVIRRQCDWSESLYKQLIFNEDRFNRYLRFDELFSFERSSREVCHLDELDWLKLVLDYHEVFGSENVLVLPYEMFARDPSEFISRLDRFIGCHPVKLDYELKENAARHDLKYAPKKKASALSRMFNLRPVMNALNREFEPLDVAVKDQIMSLHHRSNKELSKLLGLCLDAYEY